MKKGIDFYDDKKGEQIKDFALLSQVAHMYYNLDMQQPEIAKKMFFSRSKVSRMLTRARELGIVEIKVKRVFERVINIEQKLKSMFGIKEAIVVATFDDNNDETIDAVTDFAALYVSSKLKGDRIVGISRGNTIIKVVNKIKKVNECNLNVVQLMGSTTQSDSSTESRELANTLSKIYSGTSHYLNTPLYVDNLYVKEALLQDRTVQNTFNLMKRCNIILTGIGGFDVSITNPNWFGYLKEHHLEELKVKSAVGSICGQFFDIDGKPVPCEWNEKCIVMPFEYLYNNNLKIGVAAGKNKPKPILGALRGHLIDVIITDVETALSVVGLQEELLQK